MGHNEEFWNMFGTNRVNINLLKVIGKNIFEMINSFVKTRPIFQASHSRDFMYPKNAMYIAPLFKKHNL
jgi:hypothetical protein